MLCVPKDMVQNEAQKAVGSELTESGWPQPGALLLLHCL